MIQAKLQKMMAEGLRHPILSEEEILDFFKESFLMTVKKDTLCKPTFEFVSSIYERFIYDFGVENYTIPQLMGIYIDHSNIYNDWFALCNLWKYTQTILEKANFNDFTLNDLFTPKRKKTLVIFSQLIGIWVQFFTLQGLWQRILIDFQDIPEKRKKVESKVSELSRGLEVKSCKVSELRNEMREHNEKVEMYVKEFEEHKEKYAYWKKSKEEIKRDILFDKQKLSDTYESIALIKEEIQNMKLQLVSSPEKILRETDMKSAELEEKRTEKKKFEKQYSNSLKEIDLLSEAIKDLMSPMNTLKDIFSDCDRIKDNCFNTF